MASAMNNLLQTTRVSCGARCGNALYLQRYSAILGHSHTLGREKMIKSGHGSLKVDIVAKFFDTYNPTILKILDLPPEYDTVRESTDRHT